jgi:hypothetical protein
MPNVRGRFCALVSEVFSVEQKYSDKREDTRDASEGGEKRNGMQANVQRYAADKRHQKGDSESQPVAAVVNADGVDGAHDRHSMSEAHVWQAAIHLPARPSP